MDDSGAIQAALDAGAQTGRPVYLAAGTYLCSRPLTLVTNQCFFGDGRRLTVVRTPGCSAVTRSADQALVDGVVLRGLGFETSAYGANDLVGLDLVAFSHSSFSDLEIRYYKVGMRLSRGPMAEACFFNEVRSVRVFGCAIGVFIDDSSGYSVNGCTFSDIIVEDVGGWAGGDGFVLSGYGHSLTGLYAGMPNGNSALRLEPCTGNCIISRLYGESSMAWLVDNDPGTAANGTRNYLLAPHIDSLTMQLRAQPGDPYLVLLAPYP